jgi:hypothetical protein
LLFNPRHSSALLGAERHEETGGAILDLLLLSDWLSDSIAPAEFNMQRRRVGVTRQWLRRFAEASIKQLPEGGDSGGVWFSACTWREAGHLGEGGDGGWPVLLSEIADLEDDLGPAIRVAACAFAERSAWTAAASAG